MRPAAALLAAGAASAAALGFALAGRTPAVPATGASPGEVDLPASLPDLLRAHLDPHGTGRIARVDTAASVCHARMRLGPLPPLAASFVSLQRVGYDFVHDIALTWFGLPYLRAEDAYLDGRGMTRVAGRPVVGPEIDQGANLAPWSEALTVPSVFATRPGLEAFQEDGATIRLVLPCRDTTDTARLSFREGRPFRFSALRHRSVGGPKIGWHVEYLDWRTGSGFPLPGRIEARWEDQRHPWFVMEIKHFVRNPVVEPRFSEVRRLFPPRPAHDRPLPT